MRLILPLLLLMTLWAAPSHAAGTLAPAGSPDAPLTIVDHHLGVVINNGHARSTVTQRFRNDNERAVEGVYSCPVPISAALSEVRIAVGERVLEGEVVERQRARQIYEEERDSGGDAGLTEKNGYQDYRFLVANIPAGAEVSVTYVTYQALEIDSGIGRYLYPLEDGGTDEQAKSFWLQQDQVSGGFSADIEIKSAWPVLDVRVPGWEGATRHEELAGGHHKLHVDRSGSALDEDLLLYYRLADDLPGRVELLTHKPDPDAPGTFMLVVTPGIDLKPLEGGSDYVFVLDTSGSMSGKIGTLADAVTRALGGLRPQDRFRVVTFNDQARALNRGFRPATPEAVGTMAAQVAGLRANGGTDMHAGLKLALDDLDDDRVTSVILVTDAVANRGVVDPAEFAALLQRVDVRVFGFLLGNSANQPLMRLMADTSGGFTQQISNADDILGQLLLARSKVTHESLHDASLSIRGVRTFDTTDEHIGKVYRGQQLVLFGRYSGGGEATVSLDAKLSGEDRSYTTRFDFPEQSDGNPELERLWALERIEQAEARLNAGLLDEGEARDAIASLGVDYQLVTDHTSMLVLDDDAFTRHGFARRNRDRSAAEHAAQAARASQPAQQHRVDSARPAFKGKAPRLGGGGGGGAFDPLSALLAASLGLLGLAGKRRR